MLKQRDGQHTLTTNTAEGMLSPVASGISRLTVVFVNLYTVDLPDGRWLLVDTGIPNFAWYVHRAVESHYGPNARPEAIILTHGHFDHAGNARELADAWDVPIYAHSQELPYLTGRSDYAPADPTPGGAICFLSRFFPTHRIDLGKRIQALPPDGSIPHLPGWRWIHTPGHSSGHVSLFGEVNRVLLAADAVATTDLDAWSSQFTWPREIARPATPFTPDWASARQSIRRLAELNPHTIAAGHGLPITGDDLGNALKIFADTMREPAGGRYAGDPALYAPDGSVAVVPPPVADPLPRNLALIAAGGVVALTALLALRMSPSTDAE